MFHFVSCLLLRLFSYKLSLLFGHFLSSNYFSFSLQPSTLFFSHPSLFRLFICMYLLCIYPYSIFCYRPSFSPHVLPFFLFNSSFLPLISSFSFRSFYYIYNLKDVSTTRNSQTQRVTLYFISSLFRDITQLIVVSVTDSPGRPIGPKLGLLILEDGTD